MLLFLASALAGPAYFPPTSSDTVVPLSTDFVESANTLTTIPGLSCPTESGGVYFVQVYGDFDTALTTTGLQWGISSVGASGSFWATSPASGTSFVSRLESITAGTLAAGTGAGGTAGNPFAGFAMLTGAGNDVLVKARSEVGGSAITIKSARTFILCRRVG